MNGALAEGEIAREGRRVLRKLARAGAVLAPRGKNIYAVRLPKGASRFRMHITAALVETFRRRGWLAPAPQAEGAFVLSDAGLGWLRRAFAEDDPFAAQHQLRAKRIVVDGQGVERLVTVNDGESPLGWLYRRRGQDGKPLIGRIQFEAGERLRRDFTLAQLTPRLAADLSAPVMGGKRGAKADAALPEIVLAAKQRVARALSAVGPGLADLLLDVCCLLTGLEAAERAKGWPQRSAKIVLQIALDRLAVHYGMGPAVGVASARIHAWHAPEEKDA